MRKQKNPSHGLSEVQRRSWKALFVTSHLVEELVDEALNEAGLGPQSEYDFLYTLLQAKGATLTLKEIAASLAISHSGLSRMVDRLEKRGYVARHGVDSDKRSVGIQLLDAGERRVADVWETMSTTVQEHFAMALSDAEHEELYRLMCKVLSPVIAAKEKRTGLPYLHKDSLSAAG